MCIRDGSKVWYKVLIDLKDNEYDYVSGYCDIDHSSGYGLVDLNNSSSSLEGGYFYVEDVDIAKLTPGSTHPFSKAAYQYLQLNRPDILYNMSPPSGGTLGLIMNFIPGVISNIGDLRKMTVGFNNYCKINNYGEKIKLGGNSIIKLYDEDQVKKGGGSRVAKLTLDDNWESDNNGLTTENYLYGQEYNYSLSNGLSSGVAYEPRIGGEESVLRKPVDYSESTPLSLSLIHISEPTRPY